VDQLTRAVQGDPLNLVNRQGLAYCLNVVGRHAEAEQHLRQNLDLDPNFCLGTYAGLLVRTGEPERGKELIFHCYCDEIELAMNWAEKAIEQRHPQATYALQGVIAARQPALAPDIRAALKYRRAG
jgi:tetratricopeptide (TPR) repeat protein